MNAEPSLGDVAYLDLADPAFSVRSEAVRRARAANWYARTPFGIAVLRYPQMRAMIVHPSLRQGSWRWPDQHGASGIFAQWWKRIMLNRTGADHERLRKLGAPAFASKLVRDCLPGFQALADELIRGFEHKGQCEFISEFAEPYATRVICALTGFPDERWAEFAELAADMGLALGVTYAREEARVDRATARLLAYAEALAAQRRVDPRDDFIGTLIEANEDKDTLSDEELYDMIVLTLFAGIDTTRSQLGLAMELFIEHPDQWRLLAEQPELARFAVEEVMRHSPTITWVTREAVEAFVFEGLRLEKGTIIHLFAEAAGTDPEHFEAGFDIAARRKPHFGFGGGPHYCIGSAIARGDMTEALALLARRLPNPIVAGEIKRMPVSGNTGLIRLPMRFGR